MQLKAEQIDQRNVGQVVTVESQRDGLPSKITGLLEAVETNGSTGVYLTVGGDEFHFDQGETVDIRRGVELGAMTKLSDDVEDMAESISVLMESSAIMHKVLQGFMAERSESMHVTPNPLQPA